MTENNKKKPTILFINRIFPPDKGATALRLYEMAETMAAKGWLVTILAAKGRDESPEGLHPNITVRRMRTGSMKHPIPFSEYPWLFFEFAWSLLWIRTHDVTVTMTDPPMLACVAMIMRAFKRRSKLIHWSHDVYPEILPVLGVTFPQWFMKILKCKMAFALRRHHKIVVIGRDMAKFMQENKGVPDSKIEIINNWPDTFFNKYEVPKDHENPFVHQGITTFLYSGNFGLAHEFETVLQGIKLLGAKDYPVHFLFAGQGRQLLELQERVAELELKHVQFLGYQPENRVRDLLDAGDVHLATMKNDALGLLVPSKVNSAFALSKPVIFCGSKESEAAKLIVEYRAGYVIDPNEENAQHIFAQAVVELITNKSLMVEKAAGSAKCAEHISQEKMAGQFEELARSLLS